MIEFERAHAILNTAHNAFVSMDVDGRINFWNRRAEELFGRTSAEAMGMVLADAVIPERFREAHWQGLRRFLETGRGPVLNTRIELAALRYDGTEFPIEITISAIDEDGGWSFHAFIQDVSERKEMEQEREQLLARVEALARTDPLTGLPNRRAWDEELRRELARAKRTGHEVTVAMLDLDGFKAYNDLHGHPAGDTLLRDVAASWRLSLRVSDFIARLGGDEFAVLMPQCPNGQAHQTLARLGHDTDATTFSAGLAFWDDKESEESLISRADIALYEAKRAGKDRIAPPFLT